MITLLHPLWLLLALPLGASLWLWRMPTATLLAMRALLLTLILLGAAGLAIRLPSRVGTVVVVADRSRSMPPESAKEQIEAIHLIEEAMGGDDRLAVVSFGEKAGIEQLPVHGRFGGFTVEVGGDASSAAEALDSALSLISPQSPGRVLVLSDGRFTGRNPMGEAARAAARGVAIDYRLLRRPLSDDLAIERIDAPVSVSPGESFFLSAWVHAPAAQEAVFELRRDDVPIAKGRRTLSPGHNRLVFRDRASTGGTNVYTLALQVDKSDPTPENNTARALVTVAGPRPLLLATASPGAGLASLLKAGKIDLRIRDANAATWSLESLAGHSGVVLENVPAQSLGPTGMETLAAWIRTSGGGLMITGGRQSYGPGGYFQSPLDPIIPVSMELRQEHRKLAISMAIALDRSGSMSATVAGGKTKMDMANAGTAKVIELLSPMDEVAVMAVDTAPHMIVPLQRVTSKSAMINATMRIESMGGGIYVYEALVAAAEEIRKSSIGTKHIILFADAADAEQPGDYRTLVSKCRAAGITVSVIGLGTDHDPDAAMLRDLAAVGGGRCMFSNDPLSLPQLFAQEAFVVARSTFVEEATAIKTAPPMLTLAGVDFGKPPDLGGYNLTYLKPEASLGAVTLDEYSAPVVASWHVGAGRVLAYTGEADGKFTGPIAQWEQAGNWFSSMARWTAGEQKQLPDGMLLTQDVRDGVCKIELHLDPERQLKPMNQPVRVTTLRASAGERPSTETAAMEWTGPDTLTLNVPLRGSQTALSTVDVAGQKPVTLAPACLPYSPEYAPALAEKGEESLQRLAAATGGQARLALPDIWKDVPRLPRFIPLEPWLFLAAVIVLLLEVLQRRTGLLTGGPLGFLAARLAMLRRHRAHRQSEEKPAAERPGVAASKTTTKPPTQPPNTSETVPTPPGDDLLTAMKKARSRADERTGPQA